MKAIYSLLITCLVITLSGCKRDNDQDPALQAKSINTVTFTTADNPLLAADISGTVSNDTVKISFPASVNLNGLIPTINHGGESITPASRTAQNFSSPVVYTVTAKNGSTHNYTFQARNISMSDSINMLSGRWRVVKDSVAVFNFCYSCAGGPCWIPIPGVWIGASTDYWDFKSSTLLELKYSSNVLSGAYEFVPGHIKMANDCLPHYFQVLTLNSNTAVFYFTHSKPNGGYWNRMVWLTK